MYRKKLFSSCPKLLYWYRIVHFLNVMDSVCFFLTFSIRYLFSSSYRSALKSGLHKPSKWPVWIKQNTWTGISLYKAELYSCHLVFGLGVENWKSISPLANMDKEGTPDDLMDPPAKLSSESQPAEQSSTASYGDGHSSTSSTEPPATNEISDGMAATATTTSSSGPGEIGVLMITVRGIGYLVISFSYITRTF